MTTFVGVRIEGGFLEVGFKATTRREYETHIRMVAAAADLFWPQVNEPPDLSRDPSEGPTTEDFAESPFWPGTAERKPQKHEREWLERQGLA